MVKSIIVPTTPRKKNSNQACSEASNQACSEASYSDVDSKHTLFSMVIQMWTQNIPDFLWLNLC